MLDMRMVLHFSSVRLVHAAVLAQAFELRICHAASRLSVESGAEAEHSTALQQRGELSSAAAFLLVVDVTAGTSSQDGKLRDTNERHTESYR